MIRPVTFDIHTEQFTHEPWHKTASTLINHHRLTYLLSEPGCGKTTFAKHHALKKTGREPIVMQCSAETERASWWGFFSVVNGETAFIDGPLPRSLKATSRGETTWLLCEEMDQSPVWARSELLPLRSNDSILNPITGESLTIPPAWRLIATSNIENFGCNVRQSNQARALLDGFMVKDIEQLSYRQIENRLHMEFKDLCPKLRKRALSYWTSYNDLAETESRRQEQALQLGYRPVKHFVELMQQGDIDEEESVRVAFVNAFITSPDLHEAAKLKSLLGESIHELEDQDEDMEGGETDAPF